MSSGSRRAQRSGASGRDVLAAAVCALALLPAAGCKSPRAYNVEADAWSLLGSTPAPHVTTPLVYWQGMHVVPSGEIRPGVRSPKVYGVRPTD